MNERLTCLLVDDLDENLLALSALLERDDVHVLTARSGAEALELLLVHDVALALIDVQMPEMDGFELAELMRGRESTRRIPIIFVTAASREASRMFKGYSAGAVDFLYKPIDPVILESKANVFFELHRYRVALADELRQRSETLRLNEMFMAVLGHDLRNPLNAISTAAYVLQRRSDDQGVQDLASRILTSGQRMNRLIGDLLDLARARLGGGIPLQRTRANLSEVVEAVVHETRTAHPDVTIELICDGDPHGDWDVSRVQQIASNLVSNAVQHGDRTVPLVVRIDGTDAERVLVTVANGGAIPADVLPSIFDPFRANRQRASEGLGLGLFIARQIAEAHQGTISVESRETTGTILTVTLPRCSTELVRL